jgi:replication-associated recombination protein RarA
MNTNNIIGPAAQVLSNVTKIIDANLERGRASVIMLAGPSGTGKTSIADIVARDYAHEMDRREYNGTDIDVHTARAIRESVRLCPLNRAMVIIINEFHACTALAQDSLLTTLETLPPRVVLLATCNFPEKLSTMTQTRFKYFDVPAPAPAEIAALIADRFGLDDTTCNQLAVNCAGSVRQAIEDADTLAILAA